jgi:hypothetical protein
MRHYSNDIVYNEEEEKEDFFKKDKNRVKIKDNTINNLIYYFDEHILNNKKIKWEAQIIKLKGWCCIGICESAINNYFNDEHTINYMFNENKEFFLKQKKFLLTNNNYIIKRRDEKNTINIIEESFSIKEGDTLTFFYSPKYKHLKIQNNYGAVIIKNIEYYGSQWLVPCIIYSKEGDSVILKNFRLLFDYNRNK